MPSGAAVCTVSRAGGGGGALGGGACCVVALEEEPEEVASVPEPTPGLMGPLASLSGTGDWGEGASGTADGCCVCCASAAGLKLRFRLRSAVSAIAVKPGFTGIIFLPERCNHLRAKAPR